MRRLEVLRAAVQSVHYRRIAEIEDEEKAGRPIRGSWAFSGSVADAGVTALA